VRLAVLLAAGCAQTTGPHLSSAMPQPAAHGQVVTITGERMCDGNCMTAAGEFAIGGEADTPAVQLPVVAFADSSAQVSIPDFAPSGTTSIILSVNGSSSNALAFEVLP
jgi:hypothetical protein